MRYTVPLQSGLGVIHIVVYLVQHVDLAIQLSQYLIGLLVHLVHADQSPLQGILTLLLSAVAFLNDHLPVVAALLSPYIFRGLVLVLEKVILSPIIFFVGIQVSLKLFLSLLKLFELRLMRSHIIFKNT